jgi:hypothetical protein
MEQFHLAENPIFNEFIENCPEMAVGRHIQPVRQPIGIERAPPTIGVGYRAHDDLTAFIALFGNER